MKKVLTILIIAVIVASSLSCGAGSVSETAKQTGGEKILPPIEKHQPTEKPKESNGQKRQEPLETNDRPDATPTESACDSDSYFFPEVGITIRYDSTYEAIEKYEDTEIEGMLTDLGGYANGRLYKIDFSDLSTLSKGVMKGTSIDYDLKLNERIHFDYFYVEGDKIFKFEATEENLRILETGREIPPENILVCQDRAVPDKLKSDEKGIHYTIRADGNKREYFIYDNRVETGYHEVMIWEKGKGLIKYMCWYGSGRDCMEMNLA